MPWDTTMPSDFVDGSTVDETDLDPIVKNLAYVRYATVFQGGVRRTTTVGSITTTEVVAMSTPNIVHEAGTLYVVQGFIKWLTSAAGTDELVIRLREGTGLAGAVIQSFASPRAMQAATGYMVPFNAYVKATSAVTRAYTATVARLAGGGTVTVDTTSQMVVLRSGDSTLMTDV